MPVEEQADSYEVLGGEPSGGGGHLHDVRVPRRDPAVVVSRDAVRVLVLLVVSEEEARAALRALDATEQRVGDRRVVPRVAAADRPDPRAVVGAHVGVERERLVDLAGAAEAAPRREHDEVARGARLRDRGPRAVGEAPPRVEQRPVQVEDEGVVSVARDGRHESHEGIP